MHKKRDVCFPSREGVHEGGLIRTVCCFSFPEHGQSEPRLNIVLRPKRHSGADLSPGSRQPSCSPVAREEKSSSHYPSPRHVTAVSLGNNRELGEENLSPLQPAGVSPCSGDKLHIMSSGERVPGPAIESSSDVGLPPRRTAVPAVPAVRGTSGFCCTARSSRRFCRFTKKSLEISTAGEHPVKCYTK